MKKTYIFILTLLFAFVSLAQTTSIKGKIITELGDPIPNVNVTLQGTSKGTYTNTNGNYSLKNITVGTYKLVVTNVGYLKQIVTIVISEERKDVIKDITLIKSTENLDEVIVDGKQTNKFLVHKPSTSLRLKTETAKLPQNIQIISNELIENQNIISMMENVTRNVSGAQMIEHWGSFARINMRGFKLPAFRNGMNMEMPWGPLSEDMSMVETIEFVKGPSGFMMAAGEPGGFYNVVTKKPTTETINTISVTAGNYNTFRGTLDSGGKLTNDGKLQYRFNGMYSSQESHRDYEESERLSIVPSVKYLITDKTSISTEFTYQKSNQLIGAAYVFALPKDGLGGFNANYTSIDKDFPKTTIEEYSLFTNITHIFNDKWSIEAQHAYMSYNQEGASFWTYSIDNIGNADRRISLWDALTTNQLGQIYFNGEFKTGSIIHKIMGGYDFRDLNYYADWSQGGTIDLPSTPFNIYNPVYGNAIYPEFNRTLNIRERGKGNHQGINYNAYYFQDEMWMLQDKLRLTLAGRYTDAEVFAYGSYAENSKFTPRIGISYNILPDLSIYSLYDQTFSPQYGASFSGERFKPVEAKDIEAGLKKSWFNGKLNTSITAYQITKENIKVGDLDNPNFSIQLGEVQSKGVEFDMQGKLSSNLDVVFNYANTNVKITKDTDSDKIGNKLAGHAKHITNGWANYTFKNNVLNGFGISLGYQYQIDRATWQWAADNEALLPDYFRLDGGISWKNKNVFITLNVNNILNKHLFSGSAYSSYIYWQSEPGINGRVTLTYKF